MLRASRIVGLVALALTAACSSLSVVDGELLLLPDAAFREGQTRRSEVLARLGPPARISAAGSGLAFLYERLELSESQLGFSLDLLRMPYVKVSMGSGEAERAALVVLFDRDGVLRFWRVLEWSEELGSGTSAQFLFTVQSVVDTSFLDEDWDPNDWGSALLSPLPEGLNAATSVDLGRAGFELRGTPDSVGQRTLAHPDR